MTVAESTAITAELVAELTAGVTFVDAMFGIGLVKDSEAVYFQYVGEKETVALVDPKSGKAIKKFGNALLTGISVAEDIGEFKSTKLNIYLQTAQGRTFMLTSGLNTIWSQCVLTGLMGLWNEGGINQPISIETWKGNSKMKPCFAAIKFNEKKVTDTHMYEQLRESRSAGDQAQTLTICKQAVELLNQAITGIEEKSIVVDVPERTEGDY